MVAQSVNNPLAMTETSCNAGGTGLIPGSRISPKGGLGNPHQGSVFVFCFFNMKILGFLAFILIRG